MPHHRKIRNTFSFSLSPKTDQTQKNWWTHWSSSRTSSSKNPNHFSSHTICHKIAQIRPIRTRLNITRSVLHRISFQFYEKQQEPARIGKKKVLRFSSSSNLRSFPAIQTTEVITRKENSREKRRGKGRIRIQLQHRIQQRLRVAESTQAFRTNIKQVQNNTCKA